MSRTQPRGIPCAAPIRSQAARAKHMEDLARAARPDRAVRRQADRYDGPRQGDLLDDAIGADVPHLAAARRHPERAAGRSDDGTRLVGQRDGQPG